MHSPKWSIKDLAVTLGISHKYLWQLLKESQTAPKPVVLKRDFGHNTKVFYYDKNEVLKWWNTR